MAAFIGLVYGNSRHSQQYFSYIVAVSFIGGGNRSTRRKPLTSRRLLTNFITLCCIENTSPRMEFEFTTLVMIGTDCIGSCSLSIHKYVSLNKRFIKDQKKSANIYSNKMKPV
jgi:hypothetical protein